jgi:RNA polymerase sigma factor (sigma-70 family)
MAHGAEAKATAPPAWGGADSQGHDAFDTLFRREYGRVLAIARRVVGDADEAADVAQEVFLGAYGARANERPNASGWLYAAAAHTALNHVRSARRRLAREAREAHAQMAARVSADRGPEGALEYAEQRLQVRRALLALPERQAAILVLRHSGLSYGEVARALGLRASSVGTLLRRAEIAMRKEWQRHASE